MTVETNQSANNVLPSNFLNGFATAAYQIEGGYQQDGRGLTVWDVALEGKENGNEACNSYNMIKEDVALLKELGSKVFRFSIAWSRIIPKGGRNDPVNQKGIDHYNELIDALLEAGITPFVTLFHWDLPVELRTRYKGFRASPDVRNELIQDFNNYARICYQSFGDRVKHWLTHNEPVIFLYTHWQFETDMSIDEKWNVGDNLLLTHAYAVDLYRREFQPTQQGVIGITFQAEWMEPIDDSDEAKKAAERGMAYSIGWFADPVFLGRPNPIIAKDIPFAYNFTDAEWDLVRGSSEVFGINHYSTHMAISRRHRSSNGSSPVPVDIPGDLSDTLFGDIDKTQEPNGVPLGRRGHNGHPYDVPWGFHRLLTYIYNTWAKGTVNSLHKDLPIYVTENGYAEQDEKNYPLEKRVQDEHRIQYFQGYLKAMVQAVSEGVPVAGYMAWSLLDNLEWSNGYDARFGVTIVNRDDGTFKRTPKNSAYAIKAFFEDAIKPKAQ